MRCPRCRIVLEPQRYEGTEIDRCTRCGGAWLDTGELTRIVETVGVAIPRQVVKTTLAGAFSGVPEDEKRSPGLCPTCNRRMDAFNYDYASGVVLNRCPKGHGTWLDGGELEKVQAHYEHWAADAKRSRGN